MHTFKCKNVSFTWHWLSPLQKKKGIGKWCKEYKNVIFLNEFSVTDISPHIDKMQFLNPHSYLSILEFFWSLHPSQPKVLCAVYFLFSFLPPLWFFKSLDLEYNFKINILAFANYSPKMYLTFSPTEILEIICNILAWYLLVSNQDTVYDYEELFLLEHHHMQQVHLQIWLLLHLATLPKRALFVTV